MTDCPDCARPEPDWPGMSSGCRPCRARALARLFLAHGERGQRYRRACEQLGVTDDEVRQWAPKEMTP